MLFRSALVSAVVLSSGIGPAITEAISTILPSFIEGSEIPTEEQLAEALSSFGTISLSEDEHAGLLLIAANPPEGMSADDAYSAAVALVADSFNDAGISLEDLGTLDPENPPDGIDTDSLDAALLLLEYAQEIPSEDDSESLFATLIVGFGFDFEIP